jgi:hypothetical protein
MNRLVCRCVRIRSHNVPVAFVGDAPLVAHNASFDIAFLNAELKRAGKPPIATERVIDTLVLARRKHAGGLTLDDLCVRYGVGRTARGETFIICSKPRAGLGAGYPGLLRLNSASVKLGPSMSWPGRTSRHSALPGQPGCDGMGDWTTRGLSLPDAGRILPRLPGILTPL